MKPIAMQIRSGNPVGGGKGALYHVDKVGTLSTLNDAFLFVDEEEKEEDGYKELVERIISHERNQ